MHENFEAPAAIEQWAKNKGYEISYTRLYLGETYTEEVNDFDFLVIMGRPQCPLQHTKRSHFDYQKEVSFY